MPILLFDGHCNLCNAWVNFIIKRDPPGRIRFASLQSPAGSRLLEDHKIDANYIDSLVLFEEDKFDICHLYFSKFESVLTQIPTEQVIIPSNLEEGSDGSKSSQEACYEYEPGEVEILSDLLPKNLSIQVFSALLENFASEQGARMTAMDNATRNADEMIDKLTIIVMR